ncbi:hypothetical protein QN219_24450 [Sinorhizobium sp. 7-81]|uniref:hypothetical protein n=1 Tax=Sinorhizobium TaxID=28105 RepID=UPI00156872F6|nr:MULTISPECIES: hypothetical protein [Sinorhizobium]MDK1388609.1 hypothetical protein [Sinorhizobium sp. 7-81]MDK1493158.1 hypothetical protein [Sinorhizobium sp. 8-89]NRP70791.1 hypothetical protein [Sinorhizobium psoraleae]
MSKSANLALAALFAATIAAGASPAFAAGSYYKGISATRINDGHRSGKFNPGAKGVNKPPPRNGAYYKGIFRR